MAAEDMELAAGWGAPSGVGVALRASALVEGATCWSAGSARPRTCWRPAGAARLMRVR